MCTSTRRGSRWIATITSLISARKRSLRSRALVGVGSAQAREIADQAGECLALSRVSGSGRRVSGAASLAWFVFELRERGFEVAGDEPTLGFALRRTGVARPASDSARSTAGR
jgi:hypothetical protein